MRPPTVNKARPGHERETEIKLFDNSKTILRTYSHTHTHTQVKRTGRRKRRSRRWQRRTCAVCTCARVACPLSRLGAGGNDRARAVTPGLRLQIALLSSVCFRPSTPCLVGQSTPRQFLHKVLSEAMIFLFLCSASQSRCFLMWACFQNLDTASTHFLQCLCTVCEKYVIAYVICTCCIRLG